MAFDAGFLSAIAREIREELSDSRLEKIFQCTRDTFVLEFRAAKKPRALFLSAGPSGGFCYLTERRIPHPETPPMFCMLLRKHLAGGRFLDARQFGFERVLRLDIEFVDAFGEPVLRTLYLEAMGKNSNLILCDTEGVILGALRTLDLAQSPERPLLCGMKYTPPPQRDGATSLLEADAGERLSSALASAPSNRLAHQVILEGIAGIGPVLAKEAVFRFCGDVNASAEMASKTQIASFLSTLSNALFAKNTVFYAYFDDSSTPRRAAEYSYVPLMQYAGLSCCEFASPSRLMDQIQGEREEVARLRQRMEHASSVLKSAQKRLQRKFFVQLSDLEAAKGAEEKRIAGDLIMQEIWRIKRGDASLVAVHYETQEEIEIALDVRLTPAQNAQRYYKQYQRAKRALAALEEQIEATRGELEYAQSIAEALKRVQTTEEADQICKEVSEWNYGRRFAKGDLPGSKKKKVHPALRVTTLESPGGFPVLVGKNNLQNEEITFRLASKLDLWFHVKNRPGPHVVLHVEGDRPVKDEDLLFAARLCVPSDCAEVGCEVDYTRVKAVKHHPSRLPGRVIYTGEKTIFVRK